MNIIILLILSLMIVASIWGAFLGSGPAGAIVAGWAFFISGLLLFILFIVSFIQYRSLRERPGLMMVHAGCAAILAGGLWGGAFAHALNMESIAVNGRELLYGKIYKTAVQIPRGGYIDSLHSYDEQGLTAIVPLGFKMYLKDFVIEYYPDGQVRDYISHIMIIADGSGRHFGPYQIEVNKPLYFGGYHFYQHSFDQERGGFTVLTVVSDNGLWLVYAGYFLLLSGVIWQFWLNPLLKRPAGAEGASSVE